MKTENFLLKQTDIGSQGCLLVTIDAMSSLCVYEEQTSPAEGGSDCDWFTLVTWSGSGLLCRRGAVDSGTHGIVTQLQREVPSRWDSPKWIWLTSSNTSSVSFAAFLSSSFHRQSRKLTALKVLAWIEFALRHSWL